MVRTGHIEFLMATSLINTECKRYGCIKNLLACYANCRYNSRCEDLRNEIIDKTETASNDINKYLSERGREPITIQLLKRGLKFSNTVKSGSRSDPGERLLSQGRRPIAEIRGVEVRAVELRDRASAKTDRVMRGTLSPLTLKRTASNLNKSLGPEKVPAFKLTDARVENPKVKKHKLTGKKKSSKRTHILNANKREAGKNDSSSKLATVLSRNRKSAAMLRKPKRDLNPNGAEKEVVSSAPLQAQDSNSNQKTKSSKPARSKKRNSAPGSRSVDRNEKLYIILEGKTANIVNEQALMAHLFTNPSSGARYFEASEVEARVHIVKK
jgi:hypothetical protein